MNDMKIWVNCEFSKKLKVFFSVSTTLSFISLWTPICPHSTVNNPKRLLELKHRHAASNPLAASLESLIGVSWLAYLLISIGNGRCCFLLSWPVAGAQKSWFECLSFWPLVSAVQFSGWLFGNRVLVFIYFRYFISTSKRKWVPCKCGQDATLWLHGSFHQCFLSSPHLTPRGPLCLCSPPLFPVLKFEKAFSIISKHCLVFVFFCFFFTFQSTPLKWKPAVLCMHQPFDLIKYSGEQRGGSYARQAKAKWELDYSCDNGKRDLNPLLCKYIREQCPLPYINVMTFGQESPSAPPSHTQTHNHMHL